MTVRHRPLLSSPPRRALWLRAVASAALFAMLAFFGSASARAGDDSELDAELNEILSGLPPGEASATLREILSPDFADMVTESYAVSPGSLRSLDSSGAPNLFLFDQGLFDTQGGFWGCMYAPLHLPRGATVTGLVMWFVDVGGGWFAADIRRKSITSTAVAEVMGSVISTVGAGIRLVLDATISNGVIDNDNYVYYAVVCPNPSPSPELHGLYIIYNR